MTTRVDRLLFISLWLRQPFRIAAVVPSGQALAALMTAAILPEDGPVIELGAGTGVFTHALLARGVREQDLLLVEDNLCWPACCDGDFRRRASRPRTQRVSAITIRLARRVRAPS